MKLPRLIAGVALFVSLISGCEKHRTDNYTPEIPAFERPKEATVRLEGQQYPYCVWYDPNKWLIFDTPFDPCDEASEWTLLLVDLDKQVSLGKDIEKKAFAKTYPYKEKNISRTAYKDFVQSKVLGRSKDNLLVFKDLGSEERIVNNIKVFAWKFMVEFQHIGSITTFLYFYSDSEGSVAITTFTPSNEWEKNSKDLEAFLNGFCLMQSN